MVPLARRLGLLVSLRRFYSSVYDNNFPSFVFSLFSWRCLVVSTSYFPHAAINLRPPSVTVSTHTSLPPTTSLSSPPLCQTPGRRSVRNRSTLSLSRPVLSALHPQGFRTRFTLATARRSFGRAPPPSKVLSCATLSQCSYPQLSRGHGCTRPFDGLVSRVVPR